MITAKEARAKAQAKYDSMVKSEIDAINGKIFNAIDEGNMGITFPKLLYPETQAYLEDLGYLVMVSHNELRNADETEIGW